MVMLWSEAPCTVSLCAGMVVCVPTGGKLIVVAMNYRLNALGFMALPALSATDPRGVSGNYGVLDQQLAMRWVQKNIAVFGGDPNRVTVIGQSSGGTSIFALLASPSSVGLFHSPSLLVICYQPSSASTRAISLSGSANLTMGRQAKEAQDAALWLPHTPCAHAAPDMLAECLRNASVKSLVTALPPAYSATREYPIDPSRSIGWAALPHVDGQTVSMTVPQALRSGLVDVPVIPQGMHAEMDCVHPNRTIDSWTVDQLNTAWPDIFRKYPSADHITQGPGTSGHAGFDYWSVDADTGMLCGTAFLARAAGSGFKSPVYFG
eukprot:gene1762-2910_t